MRSWIAGLALAGLTGGAVAAQSNDAVVEAILQADRDFAALAAEADIENAFAAWMDSVDGRLVRGTATPTRGEAQIRALFAGVPEGTLLHWEPEEGLAGSGDDFGVTWGVWELHPDGDRSTPPAGRGTYVTVWRLNADGNWRGILDMGTDDPSYQPPQAQADSQSAPEDD
ncbi:YybH family protein [Maricaulis parjimensis]|uniref:YybH family protein n=1 Tax=Maricaulis parjimensis TaxID=144023 RepID=UPI0019393515|nr:hypothetical protein [Maricaulis parjimensis]